MANVSTWLKQLKPQIDKIVQMLSKYFWLFWEIYVGFQATLDKQQSKYILSWGKI
jgi:hypothetical protein